ncbi:hypothetical protein ES703_93484 [subsurface metagenome]
MAGFRHCDGNLFDVAVLADFGQLLNSTEYRYSVDINALSGRVIIDEADNIVLSYGHTVNFPQEGFAGIACADYEESFQPNTFDGAELLMV